MFIKLKKNISVIFLTISLFIFGYIFFRAEFVHEGNKFIFYYRYYILSFVLIIFSMVSFFINKELKYTLAKVLLSSIIFLYSIELFITCNMAIKDFNQNLTLKKYAERLNYHVDELQPFDHSKFISHKIFKKKYKDLALAIDPYHFVNRSKQSIMPLSSLSNSKTLHCNELGYSNFYQTDRFGFNNNDKNWDNDIVDFFIVGGRFAQGDCVNSSKNIAGNINLLTKNNSNILNVGQGGSGPLMSYASLREYLPKKKTKRIIWLYSESSDLIGDKYTQGLTVELKNNILKKYLSDKNFSQNLKNKQNEVDKIVYSKMNDMISRVDDTAIENNLFKFLKFFHARYELPKIYNSIKKKDKKLQVLTPKFKEILIKSKKFSTENNAEFYFVYLTEINRYNNKKFDNKKYDYNNLIKFIKNNNINLINIHKELFENHNNPSSLFAPNFSSLFQTDIRHYNEEGYILVSEVILKKINDFENQ
tara:strand:+ start:392 stop:1819 length:1428 start_codon:yes stop_codon:yes gene_type:complete